MVSVLRLVSTRSAGSASAPSARIVFARKIRVSVSVLATDFSVITLELLLDQRGQNVQP